jgi:hypothetical protein
MKYLYIFLNSMLLISSSQSIYIETIKNKEGTHYLGIFDSGVRLYNPEIIGGKPDKSERDIILYHRDDLPLSIRRITEISINKGIGKVYNVIFQTEEEIELVMEKPNTQILTRSQSRGKGSKRVLKSEKAQIPIEEDKHREPQNIKKDIIRTIKSLQLSEEKELFLAITAMKIAKHFNAVNDVGLMLKVQNYVKSEFGFKSRFRVNRHQLLLKIKNEKNLPPLVKGLKMKNEGSFKPKSVSLDFEGLLKDIKFGSPTNNGKQEISMIFSDGNDGMDFKMLLNNSGEDISIVNFFKVLCETRFQNEPCAPEDLHDKPITLDTGDYDLNNTLDSEENDKLDVSLLNEDELKTEESGNVIKLREEIK